MRKAKCYRRGGSWIPKHGEGLRRGRLPMHRRRHRGDSTRPFARQPPIPKRLARRVERRPAKMEPLCVQGDPVGLVGVLPSVGFFHR